MTTSPGIVNLTLPQGATWTLNLTWQQGGTAVNLNGYSARMQARTEYDAGAAILSLVNGSGITLGGTLGSIAVVVPAGTTANIDAGSYVYDLELESASGVVTRFIQGGLIVTPEVSR